MHFCGKNPRTERENAQIGREERTMLWAIKLKTGELWAQNLKNGKSPEHARIRLKFFSLSLFDF